MKTLTLLSTLILAACISTAQIIHVPADQLTIQQGIYAASDGDTVLVAEGTYLENINFFGKAITVASKFILNGDTNHISKTIIDGSQPEYPDMGSVVTFNSGEDTTSVLCGFTITGGTGTYVSAFDARSGGGIQCYPAGCKIMNNYIEYNSLNTDGNGYGGGILTDHEDESRVVLTNNKIRYNQINGGGVATGAGVCAFGSARIANNNITGNSSHGISDDASGGLVCFGGFYSDEPKEISVTNNLITNNTVQSMVENDGGAFGGGMLIMTYYGEIKNNVVENNTIGSPYQCFGAGIYLQDNSDQLFIVNNTVTGNYFTEGTCLGGGIDVVFGEASLINNVICNNKATSGGGVFVWSNYTNNTVPIINNTIVGNESEGYGPGLFVQASDVELKNSIVWDNTSIFSQQIYESESYLEVSYSDVEGGWEGEGNIDEEPVFVASGDYAFQINDISPCIDAGDPNTTGLNLPELDIACEPRIINEIVDMGAFEWNMFVGVEEFEANSQQDKLLNFPNPFTTSTTIEFSLQQNAAVEITVYNQVGQRVALLEKGNYQKGNHRIVFNGNRLPIGIYYCVLKTEREIKTTKMIKLK